MPGRPRLGLGIDESILDGQRSCGLDERVDAGGVGFKHRLRRRAAHRQVRFRGLLNAERAHGPILVEAGLADELRESTERPVAVVVHVPEAILGGREALREKRVVFGRGADVWHAPSVADDVDRRVQFADADGGLEIGQSVGEIGLGQSHVGSVTGTKATVPRRLGVAMLAGLRPSKEHGRQTAREMQPDCDAKPRSRN